MVKDELRKEREARVKAELKYAEEAPRNFKFQQEINRLQAQSSNIQTKQREQAVMITTLKDNLKNAQEHLVDCFLKLHFTD